MEYLRLIGVVIVLVGFSLRLRVTVIVVAAGLVTGLVAAMPIVGNDVTPGIVDTLGRAFTNSRIITLFVLSLPVIGLSERYGLQEQARRLILKIPVATVGRLQLVYQLFRVGVASAGIRLGSGHVAFSRPLVVPMALDPRRVSRWTLPIAVVAIVVAAIQYWLLDRWLQRRAAERNEPQP